RTFVDQRFVTTAWGRDYADVPPLKGIVVGPPGATSTLDVSVGVVPEPPAGTGPACAPRRRTSASSQWPGRSRISRIQWCGNHCRARCGAPTAAAPHASDPAPRAHPTRRPAPRDRGEMSSSQQPFRLAVIASGPACVYAAETLLKAKQVKNGELEVSIALFDRFATPFGLIRYGVAPDHPRIKGIITALHRILGRGDIRFLGDVEFGTALTLDDLRRHYDAVVFATGALKDADLAIPGIELDGSHGAADFVAWYDGNPDYPRTWELDAEAVAVIGNGNVALDVARVLSKSADELLRTEIPDNVHEGLQAAATTDVHIFGRRGPAQTKFSPLEARELAHPKGLQVVMDPRDLEQITEAEWEAINA